MEVVSAKPSSLPIRLFYENMFEVILLQVADKLLSVLMLTLQLIHYWRIPELLKYV